MSRPHLDFFFDDFLNVFSRKTRGWVYSENFFVRASGGRKTCFLSILKANMDSIESQISFKTAYSSRSHPQPILAKFQKKNLSRPPLDFFILGGVYFGWGLLERFDSS